MYHGPNPLTQTIVAGETVTVNNKKGPQLVRADTEGPLLILGFDDGRELTALLATKDMAEALARLAQREPQSTADDAKLQTLLELVANADDSSLASSLANLEQKMRELEAHNITLESKLPLTAIQAMLERPERYDNQSDTISHSTNRPSSNPATSRPESSTADRSREAPADKKKGYPTPPPVAAYIQGQTGRAGEAGEKGADGDDGSSVIAAYFNEAEELVFRLDTGGEMVAGTLPPHIHNAEDILAPSDETGVYRKVKVDLIGVIGTGWTLPRIDACVYHAFKAEVAEYDLVFSYCLSVLPKIDPTLLPVAVTYKKGKKNE